MEEIFLVYKTDSWHSYASRDIIGVASNQNEAINICQLQAKKEGHTITIYQLFNLGSINQSQGYEGEGEFQFEAVATDTLL